METVITGTPTPKVEWTHNGNVVKSGSGIKKVEKDNIYSLIIDKVEQIFDGDYCVKAVNASGSVQTSANLTVQGIYFSWRPGWYFGMILWYFGMKIYYDMIDFSQLKSEWKCYLSKAVS